MNQELLLNDNRAIAAGNADVRSSAYGPGFWSEQSEDRESGQIGLALMIWIPAFVGGGVFIAAGLAFGALMLWSAAVLIHSLIQPRVAVYALIVIVPIDWMVIFIQDISTVSKVVGVLAVFVSLRHLIPSITSGRWDSCAKWMVLFIAWTGASCLWAPFPLSSLIEWQTLVLCWGIPVLMCLHLKSRATIHFALLCFIMGCLIGSMVILRTNDPSQIVRGFARGSASTLLGGRAVIQDVENVPARHISIAVLLCIYFFIVSKGGFKRMFLSLFIMIMALALILLKSRAVYVGLPCAIVGGMALQKGAGVGKRILVVIVIATLVGVTTFAAIRLGFLGKGIEERFQSIFEQGFDAGHRRTLWMAHVRAFFETGFRGSGIGSMRYSAESLYRVAHNDFIAIMGEMGAPGLILYTGFHLTLFWRIRRMEDIWAKLLCLMVWLFILLASLTQNDYKNKHYVLGAGIILTMIRWDEARRLPPEYAVWYPDASCIA